MGTDMKCLDRLLGNTFRSADSMSLKRDCPDFERKVVKDQKEDVNKKLKSSKGYERKNIDTNSDNKDNKADEFADTNRQNQQNLEGFRKDADIRKILELGKAWNWKDKENCQLQEKQMMNGTLGMNQLSRVEKIKDKIYAKNKTWDPCNDETSGEHNDDTCVKEKFANKIIENKDIDLLSYSMSMENSCGKVTKGESIQLQSFIDSSISDDESEHKLVRDREIQEKQDDQKDEEWQDSQRPSHKDLVDFKEPYSFAASLSTTHRSDSLGLSEIFSFEEVQMLESYLESPFSGISCPVFADTFGDTEKTYLTETIDGSDGSEKDFTQSSLSPYPGMRSLCGDKSFVADSYGSGKDFPLNRLSSSVSLSSLHGNKDFIPNKFSMSLSETSNPSMSFTSRFVSLYNANMCSVMKYERELNLFSISSLEHNFLSFSMAQKCESKALTELWKSLNIACTEKRNRSFSTANTTDTRNNGKRSALASEINGGISEGDISLCCQFVGEQKCRDKVEGKKDEKVEEKEKDPSLSLGQNNEEYLPGRCHRKNMNKRFRKNLGSDGMVKNNEIPERKKQSISKKTVELQEKKQRGKKKEAIPRKALIKRKHLKGKKGGLKKIKNLSGKGRTPQRQDKTYENAIRFFDTDRPINLKSERGKVCKNSDGANSNASGGQGSGSAGGSSSSGSKNLSPGGVGESGSQNSNSGSGGGDDNRDRREDKKNHNDKIIYSEQKDVVDKKKIDGKEKETIQLPKVVKNIPPVQNSGHTGQQQDPNPNIGRRNNPNSNNGSTRGLKSNIGKHLDTIADSSGARNISGHQKGTPNLVESPSLPTPVHDDLTIALRRSAEEVKEKEEIRGRENNHRTVAGLSPEHAHGSMHRASSANDAMMSVSEPAGNGPQGFQHATISVSQLCDIIGDATKGRPSYSDVSSNFNTCLEYVMHDLSFSSANGRNEEMVGEECTICLVLSRLMTHMANQVIHAAQENSCDQCTQVFNLMIWHAVLCIRNGRKRTRHSRSDLCYKICKASNWNEERLNCMLDRLKGKVRKYCAKVLCSYAEARQEESPVGYGEIEGHPFTEILSTGLSSTTSKPSGTSLSMNGNVVAMESNPEENEQNELPFSAFMEPPVQTPHAPTVHTSSAPQGSWNRTMTVMPNTGSVSSTSVASDMGTHPKLIRKSSQRRTPAIPQPIVEESPTTLEHSASASALTEHDKRDDIEDIIYRRQGRRSHEDRYNTQRTYGNSKNYDSLPQGNIHDAEQFMSLWARPTGVPGVGEVVFGHPNQLRIVAGFWNRKREDCERTRNCPYQHREEGVILAKYRENFSILRTRYQKHHQWERVTHLGNGMSGKCHLAIDLKTNFKFCCKKIHLLRYCEEELSLWSEMHHSYIVKLYGAIRHGVKIYIFSEFIDGGNLATCIEEQKRLGRRLSHWSAISYFQQLLKVLAYLQTKNILHEDIKADNIILRRDTTYIAVTDFGTSRRLQDPKELKNKSPVGSPTHWSPEKASMEGHGFPSDLWAAVCVLVHMLSGEPPWVRRYLERATILNFIIYAKPPPMEDVPSNVQEVVRNLIEKGLVKDPQCRPSPSELLNHPAFQILDQGTPETYFSTLVSTAGGVMGPVRASEDTGENQAERVPTTSLESTVLYSRNIKSGQVQESDSRAEHGQGRKNDHHGQVESERVDEFQENAREVESENTEGAKVEALQAEDLNNAVGDATGDREPDHTFPHSGTQIKEMDHTSRKVSQLLEPQALDLLPRFNELFDTDENSVSFKCFYEDNLKSNREASLNVPRQFQLPEYKPEEKTGDHIPKLSLFDRSLPNSSHTGDGSYTSLTAPALPGPLEQDDINSLMRQKLTTAVKFQLSFESDECTSADLFDSDPGKNENPHATEKNTERNSSWESAREKDASPRVNTACSGEISPAVSNCSSHSSSGISNMQQKNRLKLNVTCPTDTKALGSNQSQQGSSSRTEELTKSSAHLSASSRTPYTPRKSNNTSSSNDSPSPFFMPSRTVIEDAKRMMIDFEEDLSQISNTTNERLQDLSDYDLGEEGSELKPDDDDIEAFLDTIRGEIDDSSLGGHKLTFFNKDDIILFVVRMRENPVHWKDLLKIVRTKMIASSYDHFIIQHMNGTAVDLDLPPQDNDRLRVILTVMGRGCFCEKCAYLE